MTKRKPVVGVTFTMGTLQSLLSCTENIHLWATLDYLKALSMSEVEGFLTSQDHGISKGVPPLRAGELAGVLPAARGLVFDLPIFIVRLAEQVSPNACAEVR